MNRPKTKWLDRDPLARWVDELKKNIPDHEKKIEEWETKLRQELGGERHYIPKSPRRVLGLQIKHAEITGVNQRQILDSFPKSRSTFYRSKYF